MADKTTFEVRVDEIEGLERSDVDERNRLKARFTAHGKVRGKDDFSFYVDFEIVDDKEKEELAAAMLSGEPVIVPVHVSRMLRISGHRY